MILERLVSIAESWGGAENQFDLASCCQADHVCFSVIYTTYLASTDRGQDLF